MSRSISAAEGVRCLLVGLRIGLHDPRVRRQVKKSLLVNGLVFLLLFAGLIWGVFALTGGLVGAHPGWPGWLSGVVDTVGWLLRLALIAGALFLSPPLLTLLLGIVLPMFMSPVFRAGREYAGAPEVEESGGLGHELRYVAMDVRRLGRLLLFSVLILPLNLLPFAGQAAYVAAQALIAAHTLGWDLLGRHFELHGLGYREQRQALKEHRLLVLALGFAGGALLLLPLANVLLVTTNVAGAGVLSAKLDGV